MKHKFYLLADKKQHPFIVINELQEWITEIAEFELNNNASTWYGSLGLSDIEKMAKIKEISQTLNTDENNNYIVYMKEIITK